MNTSAAYWRGRIFIGSDGGTLYSLSAKSGKQLWSARSGSGEFWYATPTVAYGRVYIGNTDGTMYVFGARSGKLLWARPLGSYIYGAAAVYRRRVFVGTYDGKFYALDAATGDVRWEIERGGAVHSAPTVMDGLVYYADLLELRLGGPARGGARALTPPTRCVPATARASGASRAGKYANPVVADDDRIYVTGRAHQFALAPKGSKTVKDYLRRARAAKRRREERARRNGGPSGGKGEPLALGQRVEKGADARGHGPESVKRSERIAADLQRVVEAR